MEYYESYSQPWTKPKPKNRPKVTSWKLVWSRKPKESIITGSYALCNYKKKQVKPHYLSGELKIIPNL